MTMLKRKNIFEIRMAAMSSKNPLKGVLTESPILKKKDRMKSKESVPLSGSKRKLFLQTESDELFSPSYSQPCSSEMIKHCPLAFQKLYKLSLEEDDQENITSLDPDFISKINKKNNTDASTNLTGQNDRKSSVKQGAKSTESPSAFTKKKLKEPHLKKIKFNDSAVSVSKNNETDNDCSVSQHNGADIVDNVATEQDKVFPISSNESCQVLEECKEELSEECGLSDNQIFLQSDIPSSPPVLPIAPSLDSDDLLSTRRSSRLKTLKDSSNHEAFNDNVRSPKISSRDRISIATISQSQSASKTCSEVNSQNVSPDIPPVPTEQTFNKENADLPLDGAVMSKSISSVRRSSRPSLKPKLLVDETRVKLVLKDRDCGASIVFTSIYKEKQLQYRKIMNKLKTFKFSTEISDDFCVLITQSPHRRTLNFLFGVLNPNCHILSEKWIDDSNEAGFWLSFDDYYIDCGVPKNASQKRINIRKLLKNYNSIYVSSNNVSPGKQEIVKLIEMAGGKVTSSYRKASLIVNAYRSNADCVTPIWLLESIVAGKVQPVKDYAYKNKELIQSS